MREVFEPVEVTLAPSGAPARVTWGRRTLRVVDVLDAWRAWPAWWEGRFPRDYYLVVTVGLTAELYREDRRTRLPGYEAEEGEAWVLARILD